MYIGPRDQREYSLLAILYWLFPIGYALLAERSGYSLFPKGAAEGSHF